MSDAGERERDAGRRRPRVARKRSPSPMAIGPMMAALPAEESVERSQIDTTEAQPAGLSSSSHNMAAPSPPLTVAALPAEESPGSMPDRLTQDMADRFKRIMAKYAARGINQVRRESVDCCRLTVEKEFCDIDDASSRGFKARKVALLASKIVVSLSSFLDEKRIRVCSGFVIEYDPSTSITRILTSATLVRSLCARNILIPDLKVKVGLPNGHVCDGLLSMLDFHYNLAVVDVKSNEKLPEAMLLNKVMKKGAVLAIGRFYDHGGVMCAQGKVTEQASTFECSELLVSSCHTTMAGVGGPLVNYSGKVVGINFYGENHTPFLSTVVISRCLDHWKNYGKIVRPWLGFIYTPIHTLPLRVLEKCTYVDKGFYISKVSEGSPADVAGLCVGDVLTKCAGEELSTAPEFGALLLDLCKEQMESFNLENTVTVEVVVQKQKDGSQAEKIRIASFLSQDSYYSWFDPLPAYRDRMAEMQYIDC